MREPDANAPTTSLVDVAATERSDPQRGGEARDAAPLHHRRWLIPTDPPPV